MATRPPQGEGGRRPFALYAAIGGAAVWLVLAGIVGAIHTADEESEISAGELDGDTSGTTSPTYAPGVTPTTYVDASGNTVVVPPGGTVPPTGPGTVAPGSPSVTGGPVPTTAPGGGGGPTTAPPTTPPPVDPGVTTGVSAQEIKVGIHAPKTIGGAPLSLADDPLKGVEGYTAYINANGGINGRKLKLDIQDDRYEASGGKDAAARLIEHGNFIIAGTLGVDQINTVANEAAKAKVPYHAGGGHEPDFGPLGLYQVSTSYDTHVIQLARWLAKEPKYKGKDVGVSALDSPLIDGVIELFQAEAKRVGVSVVAVVRVRKPTEQSSYTAQIQKLKDAGTEVFVPLQDPITTSRQINECASICTWTYAFSNFAHDADVALSLFGGEWGRQGVRGLSAWCYYLHANAYRPEHCARMDQAHAQWVAQYDEEDWKTNGQGGATGYQIVQMLAEALRRAGPNLGRSTYTAAIRSYDGFDNLISSPITFAGRSTYAHGSEKMVVYEAQNSSPTQVYKQLTPGFVEF